jgi:hypothetical protein
MHAIKPRFNQFSRGDLFYSAPAPHPFCIAKQFPYVARPLLLLLLLLPRAKIYELSSNSRFHLIPAS